MPRPHLVLPMSIDEFHHMEHRMGWKHEYWDGAAQLSPQETAVAAFQRPVSAPGPSSPTRQECGHIDVGESLRDSLPVSERPAYMHTLRAGEQLRPVRAEDEPGLAELFILTFDDAVEFAGWPDHVYRQDARDTITTFFGQPPRRRHCVSSPGRLEVSFLVAAGEHVIGAVLVRSIRQGPLMEPIMVHPAHQRRGLGTALLSASLNSLNTCGATTLYSRCHLGNPASLAWHEKNGFQEIPNYFAATHRWRHFAWLAKHFEHVQQLDQAHEMRQLAQHWKAIVQELEASDERWSSGLLD